MADLFKLAGRDVLVAEAITAQNVSNAEADSVFNSITASNIKNSTLLAADASGKIIPSTIVDALDKGDTSTIAAQTVYNPVELKKALVVPSIQGTKYTDNSGAQHSLFELGGTADNVSGSSSLTFYRNRAGTWDSATIAFTLADGLKIGDYVVGVQNWASIPSSYILTNGDGVTKDINGCVRLTTTGGTSDDFSFNSFANGKLHSKVTFGTTGPEGNGWCIDDKKIATVDVVRSIRDALAEHITAQAGDWIWLGKIAENVYTMNLSEIKPGASGTTTGATCYVSINTFQQTIKTQKQYKTVIDATCRCAPFELKHLNVDVTPGVHAGSKWFMPRMFVSRGGMASDAFTHMMAVLYADRATVGIAVDECSVFRDMSTALGTLNASGTVSPIYGMNADGFSLFATLMELDRDNANKDISVSGAHYRVTIFHPNPVL